MSPRGAKIRIIDGFVHMPLNEMYGGKSPGLDAPIEASGLQRGRKLEK